MSVLETISDLFYDPEFFWAAPLALVVARALWRRARRSSALRR